MEEEAKQWNGSDVHALLAQSRAGVKFDVISINNTHLSGECCARIVAVIMFEHWMDVCLCGRSRVSDGEGGDGDTRQCAQGATTHKYDHTAGCWTLLTHIHTVTAYHTGNNIGDEGAKHISAGMQSCHSMTTLDLSSKCDVGAALT